VRQPDLQGRVAVRFVISGQGAVASSTVDSSTLGSSSAEQCVAHAVQRIGFPQSDDGGVVIVTYPFMFTSAD
jgi:TonB family protein